MKKNYSLYGLPEQVKFCKKCTISNQRPRSTIEFKNQKQPEFHNQVAADGYSVDKEKWNVDFKKLKEQADEALNHLQKLEDSLI